MKLMIASDIHGSALYCGQLLEAFEREKADKLLLLGDLLYHGPRNDLPEGYAPKQVIEQLNSLKKHLLCVKGNCDTEADQTALRFPIMAESCLLALDGITFFATHGHIWNGEELPMLQKGTVLLSGHTHIPTCEENQRYVYMNPGSVSIPRGRSDRSYMIYENRNFLWKTLDGDFYREYQYAW